MKKFCLILLVVIALSGCTGRESNYDFPNKSIGITSIELLHNMNKWGYGTDESNMVLLRTLEGAEIVEFMNAIYNLPTKRLGTPPSAGYGEYVAKVIYENGDIEMFGPSNIELIPAGEEAMGLDTHYFADSGFVELFAQYVDIDALPAPPEG